MLDVRVAQSVILGHCGPTHFTWVLVLMANSEKHSRLCCCGQHLHQGKAQGMAGGHQVRQGRVPSAPGSRAGASSIPRIPAWKAFSGFLHLLPPSSFSPSPSPGMSPSCLTRITPWPLSDPVSVAFILFILCSLVAVSDLCRRSSREGALTASALLDSTFEWRWSLESPLPCNFPLRC